MIIRHVGILASSLTMWLLSTSPMSAQGYRFALIVFPDASVAIQNITDTAWLVDGYAITSKTGTLTHHDWLSIHEQFLDNPASIRALFGEEFPKPEIPFGEFDVSDPSAALGEVLPLPLWNPAVLVNIGWPLGRDLDSIRALVESDTFSWVINDGSEARAPWPVVFVPEPYAIVLLLCAFPGVVVLTRLRRRRMFQGE